MAKKKKSSFKWIIIGVLLLVMIIGGLLAYKAYTSTMTPNIYINGNEHKYVYLYPSSTYQDLVDQLTESGAVVDMASFEAVAKYNELDRNIKPGKYELSNQMSNIQLVRNIRYGRQTPTRLTFNNIRTQKQLCDRLAEQLMMTSEELQSAMTADSILTAYDMKKETIISIFIPNTYEVYWTITPHDLVVKMKHEYDSFWTEERIQKAEAHGLTPVKAVTLASIVEEETKNTAEQPRVAGLYLNRLRIGMPLQADPTVKFALGDFSIRRIREGHLQTVSPYNTYLNAGLPPGPIRIPSIKVVDNVLNAESHKYIYMCASEKFDGTHRFTESFEEHKKNALLYHKTLKKKNIK